MMSVGNRYSQSMVYEVTLFKYKMIIIVNHCYLMSFQYAKMMRIFQKYTRQTGASGNISPMNKRIIDVFSAFKHVEADIVGSSSGSGILNSGKKITVTVTLVSHVHIWCSMFCYSPCMSLLVGHIFSYEVMGFS